jgi:hypothetical protein
MEEIVRETNSGYICKNIIEISNVITNLIKEKKNLGTLKVERNETNKEKYSYKYQIKKLIDYLDAN